MTAHLEHGSSRFLDSVTTHSRFPVNKAGASLLSIIQSAIDSVIVTDAACRIVLVNHKTERMFGYPASLLLDKSVNILLPTRIGAEQERRMERFSAIRVNGKRTRLSLRGVHANGEEFSVNACVSRITLHAETFLVAVLRNLDAQIGVNRKRRLPRTSELRRLAVSSQQASEVEKRRFSRELYDDIGQRLSVLKLDLDWLENSLPTTNTHVPARVAQMQSMLDKVITMTKCMASTLRPPLLDDFGLMPAVEWMGDNFQKKTGIKCRVDGVGMKAKLGDPVESAVFRVIQESLSNVEKHSGANNVWIALRHAEGRLEVMVRDDGVGIGPNNEDKPGCYGLIAMQERIVVLGGTITIENINPQGVGIHLSIPVDPLPLQ
ncbi:sensor histidine kinase [Noviherbaspirillum cavernae]|nr:PAS domain-containing sensor histidine kinase [Noviherbaspirillum cavernae]